MTRILYGAAGEGMGHAIRSKVVMQYLCDKGHELHVVASNRAYHVLAKSFPNTTKIHGLTLYYENNSVSTLKSVWQNLKPRAGRIAVETVKKIIKKEKPQVIISDYEPTVAYLAGLHSWKALIGRNKIPLMSIDNQHVTSNCAIEVPRRFWSDYAIVKYGNDLVIPARNVSKYVITTFFYPKVTRANTILVPSLIRNDIIKTKPRDGKHVLVYQTSQSNTKMFKVLKKFRKENFLIYGFNVSKKDSNLRFKTFSEQGFIDDLASCKAAITNGGFTMMSESIFLHKPVFSIPIKKQFEQICNAIYLEKEGFGEFHEDITYREFSGFLSNLAEYKNNLDGYRQKDNSRALKEINKVIRKIC
jgi:uncharacterized protein (TIGR00661 family)